jgi:hypothetical protein
MGIAITIMSGLAAVFGFLLSGHFFFAIFNGIVV